VRKSSPAFWLYLRGVARRRLDILDNLERSEIPRCKYCGSGNLVKYGQHKGVQRWWCKECQRKFADNKAAPGMKAPEEQMALALSLYYEGMGLKTIRQYLQQLYQSYPSDSTIYGWIERFTRKGIAADRRYHPEVGDVWVADETVLRLGGKTVFFWDIIDAKSRFLLASRIFSRCTVNNARALMVKAAKKAGKTPRVLLTERLAGFFDGMDFQFGAETRRITARRVHTAAGIRFIRRVHDSLEARTRVVKGFKNIKSARNIISAWPVHYNYLRPHEVLRGNTPAQKAGIKRSLKVNVR
jgi:putative transposase